MEILEQLGLAGRLLELRHTRVRHATVQSPAGAFTPLDFHGMRAAHPYIVLLPQTDFLQFITDEARRYPNFRLEMGARVQELIVEDGAIRGVRIHATGGAREVRAPLTVAADGRFSTVRRLAGLEPITTAPPMDVLWFRLPKAPGDPVGEGGLGRIGQGHILILLDRWEYWQVGYVIPKDSYRAIREQGMNVFRNAIRELAPEFAERLNTIAEWQDLSYLMVASDRLPRWHCPGLLLIGDAAHTMSPVAGVGINYAIQDAVEAANVLAAPLRTGQVTEAQLTEVQRRREWPTRLIQAVQAQAQKRLVAQALHPGQTFRPPLPFRVPVVRRVLARLAARIIGWGFRPARVA